MSTVTIPKELLTGYMIQRPNHLEINVKSPLIHSLIANEKAKIFYCGFGYLYSPTNQYPPSLEYCMNKNNNVLIESDYPNLTFLRHPKLKDGVKFKIKCIILPSELETYEEVFTMYVKRLVKFLQEKSKPIPNDFIKTIKKGLRYDGYGWVHVTNCKCRFNSKCEPIFLCDDCSNFAVKLRMNSDAPDCVIPLSFVYREKST